MKANKITKNEFIVLQAFLTHTFFVTKGYSRIFELTHIDSVYSSLLGIILGILFIYIFHKLSNNIGHNLSSFLKQHKIIKILYLPIIYLFYLICLLYPITSLSSLVNSYYLTNTNIYLIIVPFILLSFFLATKGFQNISKISELTYPFIIIITIIGLILLIPELNFKLYTPILTSKPNNIILSSLTFALFSSIPSFFLIDENYPFRNRLEGYLIGTIGITLLIFTITGILGKYFMSIYSFPEYMVLKRINLLSFIENVENIFYIPAYFYVFIMCSLSLFKINKFQKNKKYNILSIISIIFTVLITGIIFNKNYNLIFLASKYIIIILGIFFLLLGPILCIISGKKKTRSI